LLVILQECLDFKKLNLGFKLNIVDGIEALSLIEVLIYGEG